MSIKGIVLLLLLMALLVSCGKIEENVSTQPIFQESESIIIENNFETEYETHQESETTKETEMIGSRELTPFPFSYDELSASRLYQFDLPIDLIIKDFNGVENEDLRCFLSETIKREVYCNFFLFKKGHLDFDPNTVLVDNGRRIAKTSVTDNDLISFIEYKSDYFLKNEEMRDALLYIIREDGLYIDIDEMREIKPVCINSLSITVSQIKTDNNKCIISGSVLLYENSGEILNCEFIYYNHIDEHREEFHFNRLNGEVFQWQEIYAVDTIVDNSLYSEIFELAKKNDDFYPTKERYDDGKYYPYDNIEQLRNYWSEFFIEDYVNNMEARWRDNKLKYHSINVEPMGINAIEPQKIVFTYISDTKCEFAFEFKNVSLTGLRLMTAVKTEGKWKLKRLYYYGECYYSFASQ